MLKKIPISLMSLLEITLEAIAIVDDWWRCLAASSAASHLLQRSLQELQDQALFQGWRGIDYEHDWDKARGQGRGQGFWEAIDTQDTQRSICWNFVAGVTPDCHLVMLREGRQPVGVSRCDRSQNDWPRLESSIHDVTQILPPTQSQSTPATFLAQHSSAPFKSDLKSKKISAIQALPFAMLVLDSDKRVYAVNDAYRNQLAEGIDPLGCSLQELWGRQAARQLDPVFARVEVTGVPTMIPTLLKLRDEETSPMRVGIAIDRPPVPGSGEAPEDPDSPAMNTSGHVDYYYLSLFAMETDNSHLGFSSNSDVETQARVAEFKAAISYSPNGIARFDRAGHFLYVNATLMQWWACSADQTLNQSYTDIELFQKWGKQWAVMFDRAFTTGRKQTLETDYFAFGDSQALQAHLIPETDAIGTVRSLLVMFHDITTDKRAQRALVSQASREYTLRLISQHIRESLDLDRILASAVTGIQRSLQADRVLIYRFSGGPQAQIAWEAAISDYPVPSDLRQRRYCIPEACRSFFLQSERTWIVPTMEENECPLSEVTPKNWRLCLLASLGDPQAMGVQSQMVAAIIQEYPKRPPTVWGLLVAHACANQREWHVEEADLLHEVAGQLAIGIQHAELMDRLNQQSQNLTVTNMALISANARLKELSELDGLTKIANRRHFDNTLAQEWQRLTRSHTPLSLILFDVDHFKQYNDTYGHPAGDECLIQIAQTALKQLGRPTDVLARYGGEEFIVLLPETDVSGAIIVAEAIRQAIWNLAIVHHYAKNTAVFVSVSLGVASCIPTRECTPAGVVSSADQALYEAKNRGRNLWVCANYSAATANRDW